MGQKHLHLLSGIIIPIRIHRNTLSSPKHRDKERSTTRYSCFVFWSVVADTLIKLSLQIFRRQKSWISWFKGD